MMTNSKSIDKLNQHVQVVEHHFHDGFRQLVDKLTGGLVRQMRKNITQQKVSMDPLDYCDDLLQYHGAKRDGVTVWHLQTTNSPACCGHPAINSGPSVSPMATAANDTWAWRSVTGEVEPMPWLELLKRVAVHADAHKAVCAFPRIYPRQRKLVREYGFDQQRPAMAMQLGFHLEVGQLLKAAASQAPGEAGAQEPVADVQMRLREWIREEYELSSERSKLVYDPWSERRQSGCSAIVCVQMLHQARGILLVGYVECPPLRDVLKRLDLAIERLRKYAASTKSTSGCEYACPGLMAFIGGQS